MSGAYLPKIVGENRGHCDRIELLYKEYICGWIDDFYKSSQKTRDQLHENLNSLSNADQGVFEYLDDAAKTMRHIARVAYELDLRKRRPEAENLLREAGLRLLDARNKFNDALARLTELKREFVKARRGQL